MSGPLAGARRRTLPALLWILAAALLLGAPRARADERPVYIAAVPDAATFHLYARQAGSVEMGKFILDVRSGEIVYFDVNLFPLHVDFAFQVLYREEATRTRIVEFQRNYSYEKPEFILGYLTHQLTSDTWNYSFWEGDRIQPPDILRVKAALDRSFFVEDMPWRPDSTRQEQLLPQLGKIPTVTNDALYKGAEFQAFNEGRAVGRLRVVPPGTAFEDLDFAPDEIVILQESYPDLSPVAGILSTTFSTPLSHVNLRARTWGIPNAGFKDAGRDYADLDGAWVVLEVDASSHRLNLATPAQIDGHLAAQLKAREVIIPRADLAVTELRPLFQMRAGDASIYGAKAANLGQVMSAQVEGIQVPGGFGIPFYYYDAHMRAHGLDARLSALLDDPRFEDPAWRRAELEALREAIRQAPIGEALLDEVWGRVDRYHPGHGMFVRSSTNAEDLEGFNGAGLYDTIPNVKGREALGEAIRAVWASLWNLRAVEERRLFGIDQRGVYTGVLVQRGIEATAAGVLVTTNLYDPADDHSYTINAKRGLGMKVVAGTTVPEQVIFDVRYPGARVISRSDDATMLAFDADGGLREIPVTPGKPVLTEAQARRLSKAVEALVPHFPTQRPLDVEWLFKGAEVWIVQVRPFIGG